MNEEATIGPPSWALPVTMTGDLVLVHEPGLLIGIGPICVYPTGFFIYLLIIFDTVHEGETWLSFTGRTEQERRTRTRLLVRYPDGKTADSTRKSRTESDQPILSYFADNRQVYGNIARQEVVWWTSPLPAAGPLNFEIRLPNATKASGTGHVAGSTIRTAAARSEVLWQ